MDFMAELQKRGFLIVMCPGRLEITSNMAMRIRAAEERITIRDQVNEALEAIADRTGGDKS